MCPAKNHLLDPFEYYNFKVVLLSVSQNQFQTAFSPSRSKVNMLHAKWTVSENSSSQTQVYIQWMQHRKYKFKLRNL